VRKWPNKFRCCTLVDEDEADNEEQILGLRCAVRELGLTALNFNVDGYAKSDYQNHLDDNKYVPFWEEVKSLGIPVVWDIRSAARRTDHNAYMEQVGRLHRHLRRFPHIQNVLTHWAPSNAFNSAGNIPDDIWAMLKEPNLSLELLFPLLYGARWEYPFKEAQPVIRELYAKLGTTKLLWGSDMPNVERSCTYGQSLDYLRKHCTFIKEADMELILGKNAYQIYFSVTPTSLV
ncbi:MAG: amidohydrolase family protein, partial [Candidatus Hodarchaeota archaeon]